MRAKGTIPFALALVFACAACAGTPEPAEITIVATGFADDSSSIQVRAGQATHLKPQNNGSVEQDLSRSVLPIAEGSVAATPEAGHDMGHL